MCYDILYWFVDDSDSTVAMTMTNLGRVLISPFCFWGFFRSLLTFFCLTLFQTATAQVFHGVEVEQVSDSGQTVLIKSGRFRGLKRDQKALFYLDVGKKNDPNFKRIGLAEVVKVMPERSYWYFRRPSQDVVLKPGQSLRLSFSSKDTQGLRPIHIDQKSVVIPKGKHPLKMIKKQKKGPVEDGKDFVGHKNLTSTKITKDHDVEISTFENLEKFPAGGKDEFYNKKMQTAYPKSQVQAKEDRSQKKPVNIEKLRDEKIMQAYESLISRSVKRHSEYQHSLESYYFTQKASPEYPQITEDLSSFESEFEKYQRKQRESVEISANALAKKKRDGKLWSADMSQKQLRQYFIESGLSQEYRRRELALTERDGHEIQLEYAMSLAETTTPEDSNFQGKNYSFGAGYEYHFKRLNRYLKNWSMDVGISRSISFYDIGGINAAFREGHLKVGLNYYFLESPITLNKIIGFVGIGFKRGNGTLTSVELSEEFDTQSLLFPLYVGAKYRLNAGDEKNKTMHIGWGIFAKLSYEQGNKNVVDIISQDNQAFKTDISASEVKLHLGLSTYF